MSAFVIGHERKPGQEYNRIGGSDLPYQGNRSDHTWGKLWRMTFQPNPFGLVGPFVWTGRFLWSSWGDGDVCLTNPRSCRPPPVWGGCWPEGGALQSVFRVCSECVQSMFRVCSECVQSVFRVCSECFESVWGGCWPSCPLFRSGSEDDLQYRGSPSRSSS